MRKPKMKKIGSASREKESAYLALVAKWLRQVNSLTR
jgi:hypothetical protein